MASMKPENVKCPECGGPMTSRANKTTGQRFFGCNAYPNCRGTRDTDGEAPQRYQERGEQSPSERARENDRRRWR
jgi:ssDNA-binding Zn-finger/Zn-ribbon topoisomerase 1